MLRLVIHKTLSLKYQQRQTAYQSSQLSLRLRQPTRQQRTPPRRSPPAPAANQPEADGVAETDEVLLSTSSAPSITESTIRVGVDLLDTLMNLVGELVLQRNQILEAADRLADGILLDTAQSLNIVTTQLQENVMKTRMQPIRRIWHKFPRVVRDLALALDKQVVLQMEGEETELDKSLIQAIARSIDPSGTQQCRSWY